MLLDGIARPRETCAKKEGLTLDGKLPHRLQWRDRAGLAPASSFLDVASSKGPGCATSTISEHSRLATTLLLISIAPTASSREGRFPHRGEPLDEAGRRAAAAVQLNGRFRKLAWCSEARAARESAEAIGIQALPHGALNDLDYGSWAGLTFAEIAAPQLKAWLADPVRGAPDGETLEQARDRIGGWMDDIAAQGGPVCAITHPMMVRAAIAYALALPLFSTLAIDVAPLSRTILSFNRIWRLQSLEPASKSASSR